MPVDGPSTRKIYIAQLLTLGLYFFYWCAKSRSAIHRSAGKQLIPTTWLLAVPAANFWWMWQYGDALEHVSYGRIKRSDTFLWYLLGVSVPWILYSAIPSFDTGNSSTDATFNWTILAIVFGFIYLAEIVGLALFCATTQRKISHLTQSPPPAQTV